MTLKSGLGPSMISGQDMDRAYSTTPGVHMGHIIYPLSA